MHAWPRSIYSFSMICAHSAKRWVLKCLNAKPKVSQPSSVFVIYGPQFKTPDIFWRHDSFHDDTQDNDTQHNETQHNNTYFNFFLYHLHSFGPKR